MRLLIPFVIGQRVSHRRIIGQGGKPLQNVLSLTIGLILSMTNINIHAQDMTLKPVEGSRLGLEDWSSSWSRTVRARGSSISHE